MPSQLSSEKKIAFGNFKEKSRSCKLPTRKFNAVIINKLLRIKMSLCCGFLQCAMIIFYIAFGDYASISDEKNFDELKMAANMMVFQDVHVMIFIGFGFLMTFLKRYGYSSVGFNLLLAALMIQWAVVSRGFFQMKEGKFHIGLKSLMGADIAAASVLISMGAVLGKTTFLQLIVMGTFEIIVFAANEYLVVDIFRVADVGGSIVVHTFGAYFGLAVSFMLRPKSTDTSSHELEGASYNSDLFAMIGTIFLWVFWPSFNGGLVSGDEQYRAVINTYLSLAACTVAAFVISSLTSEDRKFDMVHVQNSTLAGGVAVGSICNMMIHPFGALLVGTVAGTLSVLGYKYITPKLNSSIRLHDTCGVHNLHGMPGVLSGLLAAVLAALANTGNYQSSLFSVFPGMNPLHESDTMQELAAMDNGTDTVPARTSNQQAAYQLLGLAVTLVVAIVAGTITGLFVKSPLVGPLPDGKKFDDEFSWELPHSMEGGSQVDHSRETFGMQAQTSHSKNHQDISTDTV